MASRIILFLNLFGTQTTRTSTVLNSWATVCLWRRYFQFQEENEERQGIESSHDNSHNNQITVDATSTAGDASNETTCDVVRSEWARQELSDFRRSTSARDHIPRSPLEEQHLTISDQRNPTPVTTTHAISLDHPDLRVNGMFLPQ